MKFHGPMSNSILCAYKAIKMLCRSAHSVKHFRVNLLQNQIEFGQEIFSDIKSFLTHFENHPLIGDDTGNKYMNTLD